VKRTRRMSLRCIKKDIRDRSTSRECYDKKEKTREHTQLPFSFSRVSSLNLVFIFKRYCDVVFVPKRSILRSNSTSYGILGSFARGSRVDLYVIHLFFFDLYSKIDYKSYLIFFFLACLLFSLLKFLHPRRQSQCRDFEI
jgi:hypothetical protein